MTVELIERLSKYPERMRLDAATLAALREGYVPAAAVGGLLDGWTGPFQWFDGANWHDAVACGSWIFVGTWVRFESEVNAERIRLPLARPECRLRAAAVLAAGERCHECFGEGSSPESIDARRRIDCPDCAGTGYLRKPSPCWALLPATEVGPGGLPPELAGYSPELVACHIALVLDGREGVRDVALPWHVRTDTGNRYRAERVSLRTGNVLAKVEYGYFWDGWEVLVEPGYKGDTLRVLGQTDADARLLSLGIARLNPAGIVAPWPEPCP